eukprot:COSAG02_NODE_26706_length_626_cov_1.698292_1_plen_127_part_00
MGVSEQLQEASLKNTTLVGERESLATAQPGTEVGDSLAELWRSGYVCAHLRHSSPINLSQPYFRCEFGATHIQPEIVREPNAGVLCIILGYSAPPAGGCFSPVGKCEEWMLYTWLYSLVITSVTSL